MATNGSADERTPLLRETPPVPIDDGAVEEHQASFTSLKRNLAEAKSEWLDWRMRSALGSYEGPDDDLYETAVDLLTRLAQHLNGLRDSTRMRLKIGQPDRPVSNGSEAQDATSDGLRGDSEGKGISGWSISAGY